jgi:hypothetical protein
VNAKLFSVALVFAALAVFAACGGNVVVGTGSASTGTTPGVSAGSAGGAGGQAPLNECPTTTGTGGTGASCEFTYCMFLAEEVSYAICQGDTCQCAVQYGGGGEGPIMPTGTCMLPAGTDACASGTQCCSP